MILYMKLESCHGINGVKRGLGRAQVTDRAEGKDYMQTLWKMGSLGGAAQGQIHAPPLKVLPGIIQGISTGAGQTTATLSTL